MQARDLLVPAQGDIGLDAAADGHPLAARRQLEQPLRAALVPVDQERNTAALDGEALSQLCGSAAMALHAKRDRGRYGFAESAGSATAQSSPRRHPVSNGSLASRSSIDGNAAISSAMRRAPRV